jgi:hypothetical protein
VGRDAELHAIDVALQRARIGRATKSMLLTGLRGVGKTVLLNEFGRVGEQHGYIHEHAECAEGADLRVIVALLARTALYRLSATRRAAERARRALGVLKGFTVSFPEGGSIGIDVEAVPGPADTGDMGHDLAGVFRELGECAAVHDAGVLFTLDELQYLDRSQLGVLIVGLHRIHQLNLPVVVAGAGLPSMPGLAGEAKSYAERLFSFPVIGSLDDTSAREALVRPALDEGVRWTPPAVRRVVELTQGYPYFVQEFGKHAWEAAPSTPIRLPDVDAATPGAHAELDHGFFRVRLDRLPDLERAYLGAIASLGAGPHRSGHVAQAMGKTTSQVGPVRDALLRRGLLWSPRYGEIAFTVPLFDEFLRRNRGRA